MEEIKLHDFYHHNKFIKGVKEGRKIIADTDFDKFKMDRIEASKKFKVGQIIQKEVLDHMYDHVITKIVEGDLFVESTNKRGKKYSMWINPIHLIEDLESAK
jgi:hypothetical protein